MALSPGTRLGPYEILAPLGAGGMGEVYRARDGKLNRDVAVKILPAEVAADPERRQRFEQEARAASSLNHPNIVTVYDIGSSVSTLYIAMELVEGKSLRELLSSGPVPVRKILDLAIETADGLAKAHAAGIVHRDFKPENLIVTPEDHIKILDFGLAKLMEPSTDDFSERSTVAKVQTRSGQIMGTAGYMSPEQASGQAVDFRSDQFSLGVILYEMASGRRPFQGKSGGETLAAILRDRPEALSSVNPSVPVVLRWIIEDRCLAKDPKERYGHTGDLLRELRSIREHLSEASGGLAPVRATRYLRHRWIGLAAVALALVLAGVLIGRRTWRAPSTTPPTFHPLTFRNATIWSARFAPDGQTIIYGAAEGGRPVELLLTRPESPESRPLGFPQTEILSISRSGEMALSLDRRHLGGWLYTGTLARVPIAGGAPRPVLEEVFQADWAPDGSGLAVVRGLPAQVLEFPIAKALYRTSGWISDPRVSPRGDRVAFIDHTSLGDSRGSVVVVDLAGKKTNLTREWSSALGLAWSGAGDEVWFTAAESGANQALYGVTLAGVERLMHRTLASLMIHDVSRDGRVLLAQDTRRTGILGLAHGDAKERDLSWLDWSIATDLSADGSALLISEQGSGSGPDYTVYLRKTDGSPAVRLGEGNGVALSPDGRWVLSPLPSAPTQMILLPTGAGEPRRLAETGLLFQDGGSWLPDGKRFLYSANEKGHPARVYVQDVEGGKARPVTPEGVTLPLGAHPLSPDGRLLALLDAEQKGRIYPVDGGESRPVPGASPGETPIGWSADGRSIYVFLRGAPPVRVFRIAVDTGRRELWREITPNEPEGVVAISRLTVTPDGKSYVYNYRRILSALYLVEGLK
jgi:dipeptidyl aminopeptidase/acylaminoacyl peptidase/predicted Ser/Thr protein kinase